MAEDVPGPESLTIRGIPTARRGLDKRAVEQMLEDAQRNWSALRDQHALLLARIDQAGGIDYLSADLGAMAEEMGAVLEAAEKAAHGIRARAVHDTDERIRTASHAAAAAVEEAHAQAFELRRDSWESGTGLLESVRVTTTRMIERAEADVLVIRAEAEQEAHRRVNSARKEGDDIIRKARYEADRMVNEARANADDLVGDARRDAEAAQERTRALEERRKKLMADIDQTRVARLDAGGAAEAVIEDVAPPEPAPEPTVTKLTGAGIRIIEQPSKRPRLPGDSLGFDDLDPRHPGYGDALAEEVGRLGEEGDDDSASEDVLDTDEAVDVPEEDLAGTASGRDEPSETVAEEPPAARPARSAASDVGDLFARLRGSAAQPVEAARSQAARPEQTDADPEPPAVAARINDIDPLALRDRLLMAVQNDGVRAVKDVVMTLQNEALDALRVVDKWDPDPGAIPTALGGPMKLLSADASDAGAAAASEITASAAIDPSPSIRAKDAILAMVGDLERTLDTVRTRLADAAAKDRSAELSRVFRGWRTGEAERWVLTIAGAAYHDALLEGLAGAGVTAVTAVEHGPRCPECPVGRGAWAPGEQPPKASLVPPAHRDCACGIAPA